MRIHQVAAVIALVAGLAACSVYKASPIMNYTHGRNLPEGYASVNRASAAEIEFLIRMESTPSKLYHLILDGNEPISEGWYRTSLARGHFYSVVMKPNEGQSFVPGKTYRLCIGDRNPSEVQMRANFYRCMFDFTFVFNPK